MSSASDNTLPNSILVGVSFPEDPFAETFEIWPSERAAIAQAQWMATTTGATLHFVAIIEGSDHAMPQSETTLHSVIKERMTVELDKLVDECAGLSISATYEIREGTAWQELIQAATAHEMIVVATRRSNSNLLDRVVHGSTARRILRKCPVPAWVIAPDTKVGIERVLVPVDFSPVSEQTVAFANELHKLADCDRVLLHCPDFRGELVYSRMSEPDKRRREFREGKIAESKVRAQALLGDDRKGWSLMIGNDWVGKVLPEVVEQYDVDLVVMASVARTGIVGFVMGNTAERILNQMTRSVLVIKPEGWQSPLG